MTADFKGNCRGTGAEFMQVNGKFTSCPDYVPNHGTTV